MWKVRLVRMTTRILNQILEGNSIPEEQLLSYITPIFIKGSKKDSSNYRGISVMASISKLFSEIVTAKIQNNISFYISKEQAEHDLSTGNFICLIVIAAEMQMIYLLSSA